MKAQVRSSQLSLVGWVLQKSECRETENSPEELKSKLPAGHCTALLGHVTRRPRRRWWWCVWRQSATSAARVTSERAWHPVCETSWLETKLIEEEDAITSTLVEQQQRVARFW